jgi:hypothetical protein
MAVRFTQHALDKFALLARHNFVVSEAQIIEALASPDKVETGRDPLIAQKILNNHHVIRVVYRIEGDDKVVITFYLGRRQRYED